MDKELISNEAFINGMMAIQKKQAEMLVEMIRENEKILGGIMRNQEQIENRVLRLESKENRTVNHDGYVVQKGLGHKFKIAIGSQYVGILLCKTGLARRLRDEKTSTVPYQKYLDSGLARPYTTETGYQHYQWDCDRTLEKIEKYIYKLGLWDEFIKINSVNKMKSFINMLPHAKEFEYEVL